MKHFTEMGLFAVDDKLVSIIMPAYNAEVYLSRSIASVQNQTYRNWELLIVDDGSSDGSRELIRAFTEKDSRIKLLCNQHGGTARARNTAIEVAQGEYLAFIDADDAYHPLYLEHLVETACKNHADMAICGICESTQYEPFLHEIKGETYSVVDVSQAFCRMYGGEWPLFISPWNKLYARHLFNSVRFPDGRYFEDAATINLAVYGCNKVCVVNAALYFYYVAPNSSSKTTRSNELQDREWALRSHWEFFFQEGRDDLAYCALPFYIVELISIYHRIETSDRPEDCALIRKRFDETLKKYEKKIRFTEKQKDEILKFTNPTLYDLRNMVRADGVWGTLWGFVKRKYDKLCKMIRK